MSSKNIPANTGVPLSADYPDPMGWYSALEGSGIAAQGNFNWSLLRSDPESGEVAQDHRIDQRSAVT